MANNNNDTTSSPVFSLKMHSKNYFVLQPSSTFAIVWIVDAFAAGVWHNDVIWTAVSSLWWEGHGIICMTGHNSTRWRFHMMKWRGVYSQICKNKLTSLNRPIFPSNRLCLLQSLPHKCILNTWTHLSSFYKIMLSNVLMHVYTQCVANVQKYPSAKTFGWKEVEKRLIWFLFS